jgi:carbon starvation protein CstA
MLNFSQKKISSRLLITVPVFAVAFVLTFVMKDEFAKVWKFVGISNQVLASITCWTIAMYLALNGKNHWMMTIPATFLTAVCVTYLLSAPHSGGGLAMPAKFAYSIATAAAIVLPVLFLLAVRKKRYRDQ